MRRIGARWRIVRIVLILRIDVRIHVVFRAWLATRAAALRGPFRSPDVAMIFKKLQGSVDLLYALDAAAKRVERVPTAELAQFTIHDPCG